MRGFEPLGVLPGGDADDAKKRPAHRVCGSEAARICDLLESHRGAVNHLLGGFHAHPIDELTGVHIRLSLADTGEVTGAHPDAIRQTFDAEIFFEVFEHPYLQFPKRL
jgi:hypothetical protein